VVETGPVEHPGSEHGKFDYYNNTEDATCRTNPCQREGALSARLQSPTSYRVTGRVRSGNGLWLTWRLVVSCLDGAASTVPVTLWN
jgi:hypothetical protein